MFYVSNVYLYSHLTVVAMSVYSLVFCFELQKVDHSLIEQPLNNFTHPKPFCAYTNSSEKMYICFTCETYIVQVIVNNW